MSQAVGSVVERLRGGLVVSCQASSPSPFARPTAIALMAQAALAGGAVALRIDGSADIRAVRRTVRLPIIGLRKRDVAGYAVRITPTFHDALVLARAGADLVAVDATERRRPGDVSASALIAHIHKELGLPVVADVDDLQCGIAAARAGAALVATTLSGYTHADQRAAPVEPDVELVRLLAASIDVPILAEGRFATPEQVAAAFAAGAHAVCVGTAITDPVALTRRLASATPRLA